jgi:hypothetical protein
MDVMPAHTRTIRLEDFLELFRHCKEWCVADRPAMHMLPADERPAAPVPAPEIDTLPGLSEQEQKIVAFLRSHRTASEMDLRKLLGTRRVAGIVNGLVRKAALQGQSLIGKKGVGKDGEIYEYTGS